MLLGRSQDPARRPSAPGALSEKVPAQGGGPCSLTWPLRGHSEPRTHTQRLPLSLGYKGKRNAVARGGEVASSGGKWSYLPAEDGDGRAGERKNDAAPHTRRPGKEGGC